MCLVRTCDFVVDLDHPRVAVVHDALAALPIVLGAQWLQVVVGADPRRQDVDGTLSLPRCDRVDHVPLGDAVVNVEVGLEPLLNFPAVFLVGADGQLCRGRDLLLDSLPAHLLAGGGGGG